MFTQEDKPEEEANYQVKLNIDPTAPPPPPLSPDISIERNGSNVPLNPRPALPKVSQPPSVSPMEELRKKIEMRRNLIAPQTFDGQADEISRVKSEDFNDWDDQKSNLSSTIALQSQEETHNRKSRNTFFIHFKWRKIRKKTRTEWAQ